MLHKEKYMKKWLVLIILLFASPASATVYLSANWDSNTPSTCWPCKTTPCAYSFYGWKSGDWNVSHSDCGLSATQSYNGVYSYYQVRKTGEAGTCDIVFEFSEPNPTIIHIRFYLYLTTNWYSTETNNVSFFNHFIFTNSARSNTGFRLNLLGPANWNAGQNQIHMLPEGDGGIQWWDDKASPSWQLGPDFKTFIGAWHCFEYRMQISGSKVILTEWIDGVLTRGPCSGPGQNGPAFTSIIISGWDNGASNFDGDFYIDDIVIADSYIGTSTVTPSPQPQGDSGGGGGCFIATAAFGHCAEPYVMILKKFRDQVLLGDPLGRSFVRFYYKVSPPIANFISQHESLKMLVRWGLIILVGIILITLKIGPLFTLGILLFLITLLWKVFLRLTKYFTRNYRIHHNQDEGSGIET